MKKSELKNIIKECVKEVIFEEGVLSGIITEVAQGLQGSTIVQENNIAAPRAPQIKTENRKKVLASIASNSYEDAKKKFSNPELFEGTRPAPSSDGRGPLAGVSPDDPGVDISNIPGLGSWANLAKGPVK
tara:strand:- start:525 stop:914 length:390 start_codon:yes stop_codon:yes gene_type:complete